MKNLNLINARKKADLTQKEVAKRVHIAEVSYQRLEYGYIPSLKTAFKIADALHTNVDNLWHHMVV